MKLREWKVILMICNELYSQINVDTGHCDCNSKSVINEIVDIIIPLVEPDKIILFGSYARGDQTEKSDVDLLILKKELTDGYKLMCTLYDAFFENDLDKSIDVIPVDYDKYYELCDSVGYIYYTVKREGKLVYENI